MTFDEAEKLLGAGDCVRLPDPNTWLVRRSGDCIAVRLYSTDVVSIYRVGLWSIHPGGYHTLSTKRRILKYSPASVVMRHGGLWVRWNRADGALGMRRIYGDAPVVVDSSGNVSESGAALISALR